MKIYIKIALDPLEGSPKKEEKQQERNRQKGKQIDIL